MSRKATPEEFENLEEYNDYIITRFMLKENYKHAINNVVYYTHQIELLKDNIEYLEDKLEDAKADVESFEELMKKHYSDAEITQIKKTSLGI